MNSLKTYFGELDQNFMLRMLFTIFTISIIMAASDALAAGTGSADPFGDTLCKMVGLLRGNIAKAVGIIAVFVMGVMVVQGNMKWPTGLLFASGLILIFKAADIVDFVSGASGTAGAGTCGAV